MTICPYYDKATCTCNAGPSYRFHPYKEWRSWIRENCEGNYTKCAAYIGYKEALRTQHNRLTLKTLKEENASINIKAQQLPLEHFAK